MNAPLRHDLPVVSHDPIELLLCRIREQQGFPAMSASIASINQMISVEGLAATGANTLAPEILKDLALTQKILRLVNSAQYSQYATERISTISRAIVILGVDVIRNLAVSLLLIDQIGNRSQAAALGREFLRAGFSALLARELGPQASVAAKPEEAYLCALFHHLGRLLAQCYFPEESAAIHTLLDSAEPGFDEEAASLHVLGVSYQALGIAIARSWGFPEAMVNSMRRMSPGRVPAAASGADGLRALSAFSAELAAAIETTPGAGRGAAVAKLCQRYQPCLGLDPTQVTASISRAEQGLEELARMVHLDLAATPLGQQLASTLPDPSDPAEAAALPIVDVHAETAADAEAILARGIQAISDALIDDGKLSELLKIVTETLYRALPVKRVILCLRDGRQNRMQAKLVLGDDLASTCARFQFAIEPADDLFNRILAHEVDVLIADSRVPKVRERLPVWYLNSLDAPNFLVMPLRLKATAVAMIYLDADEAGKLVISPQLFALLRTLRNQALLAIKQRL